MSNDSLQQVLAGLQKTYIASLPEKVTNIDSLWRSRDLEKLKTDYHKLKGTGRTYGLPEVSLLGDAMERLTDLSDLDTLAQAVPLSLALLEAIRDSRSQGRPLDIENEPDFKRILKFLGA